MVDDAKNKQSMKEAIDTLNQITSSNSTPKIWLIVNITSWTLTNSSRLVSPSQGNKNPSILIITIIFLNIFTY